MTYKEAHKAARRRARATGEPQFVIWIGDDWGGPYTAASDEDLDTFYSGISDQHILFCTADA